MPKYLIWLSLPLLFWAPAIPADEPARPAKQEARLTPVASLKADVRAAMSLLAYVKTLEIEDITDMVIFDIISFGSELPQFPEDADPLLARYEIYLVNTILSGDWGYAFDIVLPGGREGLRALGEDDYEVSEQGDDVFLVDNTPGVATDRYFAIAQIAEELIDSGDEITRLRRLIGECQDERLAPTISISARPATVARTFVQPALKAIRATLLTQAQRRDSEDEFTYLSRALYQKTAVSMFDALFEGFQEFEFAFKFEEDDRTCSVVARVEATQDSATHEYIRQVRGIRNRSLTWLHPEHDAFFSFSLPLPDQLREMLPALSRAMMAAVHREVGLGGAPGPAFERVMSQMAESGKAEFLWQMMSEGDAHAMVLVFPLESASTLESTSIELISAIDNDAWQLNVGEIDGWPVHRLSEGGDLAGELMTVEDLHWVLTENCLAVILRNNAVSDPIESLRQVVTRDFEESSEAQRLSRSCLAASADARFLAKVDEEFLPKTIRDRLETDSSLPLDDRATISVNADDRTIEMRATFERDAILCGVRVFEIGVIWLISWLEELD